MDYVTPEYIAVAAYNACQRLSTDQAGIPEWQEVALMIGTAAVETGMTLSPKERRNNPGLGAFSVSFEAAVRYYNDFKHGISIIPKWLRSKRWKQRRMSWILFTRAWIGIPKLDYIPLTRRYIRWLLVHDIEFNAAMSRWHYLNCSYNMPDDMTEVAEMWSLTYAPGNPNYADEFFKAWREHECQKLMNHVGYE